jgi:hypothetical protein
MKAAVQANEKASKKPPSRIDKRVLSIHLDPDVLRSLRQLALDHDTTLQALGLEAVDLLRKHYGLK